MEDSNYLLNLFKNYNLANHGVLQPRIKFGVSIPFRYDNTTGRFITLVGAKRKSRNLFGNALWEKYYACWSEAEIPQFIRESHYHYSANPKNHRFFLRLKSGLTAFESISNCAANNPVNVSDGNVIFEYYIRILFYNYQ